MVKKTISFIFFVEAIIASTYFYQVAFFTNLQVGFLSSFFVIAGSSIAYKKMIKNNIENKTIEEKRDLLDSIEDPHELYEDFIVNNTPSEELDLKEIVKEEKAKIKTFSLQAMGYGAKGSLSPWRLIPYLFLIFGFIALKNNTILDLKIYLPSLLIGIIVASISFTKQIENT